MNSRSMPEGALDASCRNTFSINASDWMSLLQQAGDEIGLKDVFIEPCRSYGMALALADKLNEHGDSFEFHCVGRERNMLIKLMDASGDGALYNGNGLAWNYVGVDADEATMVHPDRVIWIGIESGIRTAAEVVADKALAMKVINSAYEKAKTMIDESGYFWSA